VAILACACAGTVLVRQRGAYRPKSVRKRTNMLRWLEWGNYIFALNVRNNHFQTKACISASAASIGWHTCCN